METTEREVTRIDVLLTEYLGENEQTPPWIVSERNDGTLIARKRSFSPLTCKRAELLDLIAFLPTHERMQRESMRIRLNSW